MSADLEARDRGGVDDMPFAAVAADQRQENLQPVDHAVEIDADIPLPLLRRQLGDRAAVDRDAGIVAGDMHLAERLDGGLSRAAHRGAVRHVGHDRDRLRAERAHLAERRIEPVAADVAQHDRHAFARETRAPSRDRCRRPRRSRSRSCLPVAASCSSCVQSIVDRRGCCGLRFWRNEQCVSRKEHWDGHGQGAKSAGSRGRRGLRDDRRGGTLFRPGPRVRLVGAHGAGLFPDHPELSHHRHRPRARRQEPRDRRAADRAHLFSSAVRDPRRHPGVRLPDRPHRPRAHRRGAHHRRGLRAARREPRAKRCCSPPASRCSWSASSSTA